LDLIVEKTGRIFQLKTVSFFIREILFHKSKKTALPMPLFGTLKR
jgi:hypothetical protein